MIMIIKGGIKCLIRTYLSLLVRTQRSVSDFFLSLYISLIMVLRTMYKDVDPFSLLILDFSWLGV